MSQRLDPDRPTVPEVLPLVWAYRGRISRRFYERPADE